ncbi:Regulatory protein RecX [Pseudonocardia sp. Ae168_Ps1]|uniref:regulatory protein RecX n=1 Tax=unclassified Pseudonocardia TaxID=2619320 RepID=UPI000966B047|nr:Regulatory protein RecX [Pseudonocardia sp. Ae150A_Ps1]OLL82776.1 Regulatory protein RecX [Pseudonocardia sp. Ae168_Ps1]OLL83111.1 Regulatory protein RecX [Pseudonocardia sp. Ae263_Ps1]OLL90851.1 Regulatory protein RecX [Pseudonocardia sp. Ae356_Ps1]
MPGEQEASSVSLDDLFGGSGSRADDSSGEVHDGFPEGDTDGAEATGAGAAAEPVSGDVDQAAADGGDEAPPAPRRLAFEELSAGGEADAGAPLPLTVGELTEDREPPPEDDGPRVVSFDGLSGSRGARPAGSDRRSRRTGPSDRDGRRGADRRGSGGRPEGNRPDGDRPGGSDDVAGPSEERDEPGDDTAGTGRAARGQGGRGARGARTGRGGRGRGSTPPPDETPAEQETRAKDICLRLLTDRARTVKELGDALSRKEIPDDVARRVLERFDEVGLIDDKAFADQWVRSRHRHRGLGKRAIALELHRKGVDRETADEALTEIDEDSERERARELVTRRLRGLPVGSREEQQSTARKLVGMLARKGYGPGVAYGVVKEEIAAAGADTDELGEPPED